MISRDSFPPSAGSDDDDDPSSALKRDTARLSLIAHDLRSAVGDIVGGLQLVDDSTLAPGSLMQLERVRAAGDSLGRLVSEALTVISGETCPPMDTGEGAAHALIDVMRDLERRWQGHAAAQGLHLRVEAGPDLPMMIGVDRTMLERVVSNMLDNALKYCARGTVTLSVEMRPGDDLRLSVADEGPGFSAAALSRLFSDAGRPATAERPGTGMGLHIAKGLADRMGGRLSVTNLDGGPGAAPRGAEVSLVLPAESWRPAGAEDPAGGMPDLSGATVLLAEDNPTGQLVLERMLARLGAEVRIVTDGLSARDALAAGGIDLALVDIDMPLMSGLEAIAATRTLPGPAAATPILAVTAYLLREQREEIYAAGADGILAKPVMSLSALGAAIADVMQKTGGGQAGAPAPAPAEADTRAIDETRLASLVEIAGPEARSELLARLDADLATAADGLEAALVARDTAGARRHTHVLISLSGAVGAHGLQEVVEAMNVAAHRVDWPALDAAAPAARSGIEAMAAAVAALGGTGAPPHTREATV